MALDNASKPNMINLIKAGKNMLHQKAKRVRYNDRKWQSQPLLTGETNEDELRRFADDLCKERHLRLGNQKRGHTNANKDSKNL